MAPERRDHDHRRQPFAASEGTEISGKTDSPAGARMALGVGWNGSVPHVLYKVYVNADTGNFPTKRGGPAQRGRGFVSNAGGILSSNEFFSSGCTHRTNPDIVWFPKKAGSFFELYRWASPDSGTTWSGYALTSGSSADYTRPQMPLNAPIPELIVAYRTITSDTSFSAAVRLIAG